METGPLSRTAALPRRLELQRAEARGKGLHCAQVRGGCCLAGAAV